MTLQIVISGIYADGECWIGGMEAASGMEIGDTGGGKGTLALLDIHLYM